MYLIVSSDKYLKNESLDLCSSIDDALKIDNSSTDRGIELLEEVRSKYKDLKFIMVDVPNCAFVRTIKNVLRG